MSINNVLTFPVGEPIPPNTYVKHPINGSDYVYAYPNQWTASSGTFPMGMAFEEIPYGDYRRIKISGKPTTVGTYPVEFTIGPNRLSITIVITGSDSPPPSTSPEPEEPEENTDLPQITIPNFSGEGVPWSQAKLRARAGDRIQLEGWSDRWVDFDGALWWITVINPLTKVMIDRRIVQTTDASVGWFSRRWKVIKAE